VSRFVIAVVTAALAAAMPANADERRVEISGKPVKQVAFPGGVPASVDPNGTYQVEQTYAQHFLPQTENDTHPLWHGGLTGVTSEITPDWGGFPPVYNWGRRSNVVGVTPDGRVIFCFCGGTSF
jgi:hypothetical protein